ncbi:unnamed protein product [Umbelopsis vinacea]
MARISLAITVVVAFLATGFAAPANNGKTAVVSLPFSRVKATPNWKQAVTADKSRVSHFANKTKLSQLSASVTATNEDFRSSNTWVGAGTKYVPSSTAKSTGGSVSVTYGSGSFSGKEYTDTVSLGSLTITSQSIGDATSASGFSGVDGIIGFGPVDLTGGTVSNAATVPTIIDNAYSEGLISTKVLGVYFDPIIGSATTSNNGELTLGGTDSTKYSGSITYTPVTSTSPSSEYWGINISKITYGSTTVSSSSLPGIVDTGTTLVYLQTSTFDALYKNVKGYYTDSTTGLVVVPASSYSGLQNVVFTIGGTQFTLTPSEYILPQAQVSDWGGVAGTYYSLIGDAGTESGLDFILGQKFLENYYSVFPIDNKRGTSYLASSQASAKFRIHRIGYEDHLK